MSPSEDLTFPVSYTFCSKTVKWLNFNEKSENTNCSTLNACGLAIFFKFLPSLVLQYLSFFERDPHVDSPEGIRVKFSERYIANMMQKTTNVKKIRTMNTDYSAVSNLYFILYQRDFLVDKNF